MSSISGMMSGSSAAQYAQAGIQRGLAGLSQDAQTVANSNVSGASDATTGALVDSVQQKLMIEASARMLKTADQTLGTLIDVNA